RQVWLTTATPEGKELFVVCVDRESGKKVLDAKIFDVPHPEDTRKFNSFASPTPVIEEGRVYVHFGSYGTACLDTGTGKVLWARRDLECNHWRGPGSSPILWNNLLILHYDGFDVQYAVALDKKTGRTVWKTPRSHDYGTDNGDLKKGYATPAVIEVGGAAQLVSPAARAIHALEPATGKEIWRVRLPDSHSPACRPVYAHGLVYVSSGHGKALLLAIRPDGRGDVTDTHVAWKATTGVGSKPSPLLVEDLIYCISDKGGVLTCFDAKTGAEVYKQRVGGDYSASPIYAAGAIQLQAEDGTAVLVKPGRTYAEAGRGKLDGPGFMATPAASGESLFIRSEAALYRIESR
ncbi:MAG TPA: PQQ-binding-like beta-propeller repeat protein, partial [Planctomycetota bacterium]|nr:PQQ-binding-like beta-propeller repeat protein [Planctomycetota bacterium]